MHLQPIVAPHFHAPTGTWSYLVACPATGAAAIIDPVLDYEPATGHVSTHSIDDLLGAALTRKLRIVCVLETHVHADHLSAAFHAARESGAWVGIGEGFAALGQRTGAAFGLEVPDGAFDRHLRDGERFALGRLTVEVMATPGHTPEGVTYRVADVAFIGDTLFQPDVGTARCDFPGGDAATLYRSIERLLALPDTTTLYHAHDAPPAGRAPRPASSVREQRQNVHLAGGDEASFVAVREARDRTLRPPELMLPALRWNVAGRRAMR